MIDWLDNNMTKEIEALNKKMHFGLIGWSFNMGYLDEWDILDDTWLFWWNGNKVVLKNLAKNKSWCFRLKVKRL